MKLLEKYLSEIDLENIKSYGGGYYYINPYIKEVPLKNVKQLTFNSLYPNIICSLIDAGLHKNAPDYIIKIFENFKEEFEYYIINRNYLKLNYYKYQELKININSFYGKLAMNRLGNHNTANYATYVTEYLCHYYNDLLKRNQRIILYIDTDMIFYTEEAEEIDLLGFNLPFDIETINYIIFPEDRRYIMLKNNENEIEVRGYSVSKKGIWDKLRKEKAIDSLRGYIRNDKIECLGI